jgi:hypothetical protein
VPTAIKTPKQFDELLADIVKDHAVWVPQPRFPELKKIAAEKDDITEINLLIEESLKKKKEGRLASVLGQLKGAINLSAEDENKVKNLILNDHIFQKLLS